MKRYMIITVVAFYIVGCTATKQVMLPYDDNLISIQEEEEEYELLVLDAGFETWYQVAWSSSNDRSLKYYEHWNQQYVNAWNYKATRSHTSEFFDNMIQYDVSENYGMDVERKLYFYFRWVDTKLGIPILDFNPPGGIL